MGISLNSTVEKAERVVSAPLAAAGATTEWIEFTGTANLAISGVFVGTVILERSFDGGVTAIPATNLGTVVGFTVPSSEVIQSRESGVLHRLKFLARTSGTVNARISQ